MTIKIQNLAIAGYRSFGPKPQYFENFSKINIFIGQNNSGKSNILRFIDEIYSKFSQRHGFKLDPLASHQPGSPPLLIGSGVAISRDSRGRPRIPDNHPLLNNCKDTASRDQLASIIGRIFEIKARLDQTSLCWSLTTNVNSSIHEGSWRLALNEFADNDILKLWSYLTQRSGGNRALHWEPEIIPNFSPRFPTINVAVIPAIRQILAKEFTPSAFDGSGIIERLARLQNPSAHDQDLREGFIKITKFLRDVIGVPDAKIEVPYERNTILVHIDNKVLPIESLGSGIHEVLILAAAATVLDNHVICMEEPELHLNPILQKKLIRYLAKNTTNQYFITTHSAALMDTPEAEVYHVRLQEGASFVNRVTSDHQRSTICEDLGYHPSDLLQANCIIWVEGPSDRIYMNWWINHINSGFIEGIHYSIMFYGGRLAAHLSNSTDDENLERFISLRRLNRRGAILIDSDKSTPQSKINSTKLRLRQEFNLGPGHAWITAGREIENYLTQNQISEAIKAVHPRATIISNSGRYENLLTIKSTTGKQTQASKIDIARYITSHHSPDLSTLDLAQRLAALSNFIRSSNPNN